MVHELEQTAGVRVSAARRAHRSPRLVHRKRSAKAPSRGEADGPQLDAGAAPVPPPHPAGGRQALGAAAVRAPERGGDPVHRHLDVRPALRAGALAESAEDEEQGAASKSRINCEWALPIG